MRPVLVLIVGVGAESEALAEILDRCRAGHRDEPVGIGEGERLQAISLRVNEDILELFRPSSPRFQTRMNAVLRSYVTAMRQQKRQSCVRSA